MSTSYIFFLEVDGFKKTFAIITHSLVPCVVSVCVCVCDNLAVLQEIHIVSSYLFAVF